MYLVASMAILIALFASLAGGAVGIAQLWQGKRSELCWMEYAQCLVSLCMLTASSILMYAFVVCENIKEKKDSVKKSKPKKERKLRKIKD